MISNTFWDPSLNTNNSTTVGTSSVRAPFIQTRRFSFFSFFSRKLRIAIKSKYVSILWYTFQAFILKSHIQLLNKWFSKVPQTGIWIEMKMKMEIYKKTFTFSSRRSTKRNEECFMHYMVVHSFCLCIRYLCMCEKGVWLPVYRPQLATFGSTVSWKEYRIRYTKKDAKTFSLLNGIYFSWAYWMNDKTYSHNTGMSRVMERDNDMEEKWCKKNWHTEGLQFMYMMLCCAVLQTVNNGTFYSLSKELPYQHRIREIVIVVCTLNCICKCKR